MSASQWLSQFLFCYLRQLHPDGRPLYAYKCRDGKYEELRELVRSAIGPALRGRPEPKFDALFCLFAAEAWRRNHPGGSWKWDTVFESIGQVTNQDAARGWVRTGLKFWKRDILQGHGGDQEYLITIACEGGLPLKLLQRENDNLKRYFRELLDEYHRQRHTSHFNMDTLAGQTAALHLPQSLRNPIVYHLSGKIIESVVELQARVPGTDNPIAALDKQDEKWRNTLPLSLEDDTVKALLGGLMRQAKYLAFAEQQRLRWRRCLVSQGGDWTLESRLELPPSVTGADLLAWTKQDRHPNRLRLLLQTPAGKETVARLTRTQGEGKTTRYRLEELRRNGIRLNGLEAMESRSLWLSDDEQETELPVTSAVELGELPWLFVEHNGGEREWLAQGTARTKNVQAWVLVDSNHSFEVIDGYCQAEGKAARLGRVLYAIQGKVRFAMPTGEACLIQCAAEADSEEWLLGGKTLAIALNPGPIFLGKPTLEIAKLDGKRSKVENHALEWRVLDAPNAAWCGDFTACVGTVWIRALDPENHTVRLRRKAEVLPDRAQIEIVRVGVNAEPGLLQLSGLGNVQLSIPTQPGCRFELENLGWTQEIRCFADAELPTTQFPLELRWPEGRKLTLVLPFPRQGAAFVRGGVVLEQGQAVALGRLDAVAAVVQKPAGGSGFLLEATVKSDGDCGLYRKLWLRHPLKPDGNGRALFELHRWKDRLDSLLAMAGNLDAKACLEIQSSYGGGTIAKLEVARFDMEFEFNEDKTKLFIPSNNLGRLEEGWQDRVTVKMLPLWNLNDEPVVLAQEEIGEGAAWRIPDGLPTGPWWVLGCDGDWARFRPLRLMVRGDLGANGEEAKPSGSALAQAVRSQDETRPERMRELVESLAEDPAHTDWGRVFGYIQLAQTYPASALDLLVELASNPKAMALALLKSPEDQFDAVWSLAHQLPFSWHLLPVGSWRIVAERYFNSQRNALKELGFDDSLCFEAFDRFQKHAATCPEFFSVLCDWMQEVIFPDKPISGLSKVLRLGYTLQSISEAERGLLGRDEKADKRWPGGSTVLEITNELRFPEYGKYLGKSYRRPVYCAPFVAAYLNLTDKPCPLDLLFELRQLREFDRIWFDSAFTIVLYQGLTQPQNAAVG